MEDNHALMNFQGEKTHKMIIPEDTLKSEKESWWFPPIRM
jgi:hypothetical protein